MKLLRLFSFIAVYLDGNILDILHDFISDRELEDELHKFLIEYAERYLKRQPLTHYLECVDGDIMRKEKVAEITQKLKNLSKDL